MASERERSIEGEDERSAGGGDAGSEDAGLRRAFRSVLRTAGGLGFGTLLLLIIVQIVWTLAAPGEDWANFVSIVLQAAILLVAIRAAQLPRSVAKWAWPPLAAVVVGSGLALLNPGWDIGNAAPTLITVGLVILAPAVIIYGVGRSLRVERTITLYVMFGVLSIYLLLGFAFALAFEAIGELGSSQFFASGAEQTSANFLYFAFVTMTTVGYGDLAPATGVGRAFAIALALTGQIYLVTVVAIIVGNLGARHDAE